MEVKHIVKYWLPHLADRLLAYIPIDILYGLLFSTSTKTIADFNKMALYPKYFKETWGLEMKKLSRSLVKWLEFLSGQEMKTLMSDQEDTIIVSQHNQHIL